MKNKKRAPPITDADMVALERMTQIAMLHTKEGEAIDFAKMLKNTCYATITPNMEGAIGDVIQSKLVFDLGAGDLSTSHKLVELGARRVIAIEKEATHEPSDKRVKQYPMYFTQFLELKEYVPMENDVAFVSWPANHPIPGLLDIVMPCGTVIYVGKNTDGTACAWPGFFEAMRNREVVYYIPHEKNCCIVYGKTVGKRPIMGEEYAGLDKSREFLFYEAEEEARKASKTEGGRGKHSKHEGEGP